MTPEELDEARAKEAEERWRDMHPNDRKHTPVGTIAARLAREGWTPPEPEPVDPDVLAFREWAAARLPVDAKAIHKGLYDEESAGFLAGARMAREQERERAKVLVEFIGRVRPGAFSNLDHANHEARKVLAKYRGEA